MSEIEPGSLCVTERVENGRVVRRIKAIVRGTMDMVEVGALDPGTILQDLKLQCAAASDDRTTYGVMEAGDGRFELFTFTGDSRGFCGQLVKAKTVRRIMSLAGILETLDALSVGLSRKRSETRDEPI